MTRDLPPDAEVACAVSADGRWLAVRHGAHVSLLEIGDSLELVGQHELPRPAGAIAFAGGTIVVVDPDGDGNSTTVTTLRVPSLSVHTLVLAQVAPLAATSSRWIACRGAPGTFVKIDADGAPAAHPHRGPIAWAVGFADDCFAIASDAGAVLVDPDRPTAMAEVYGPPSRVIAAGALAATGELWTIGDEPRVAIHRLADGRAREIALPAAPSSVASHSRSSWIAVDTGGAAYAVELEGGATVALDERAAARALAPTRGGARVIAIAPDGGLRTTIVARTETGVDVRAAGEDEAVFGLGPTSSPAIPLPPQRPTTPRAPEHLLRAHPLTARPPERVVLRPDAVLGLAGPDAREPAQLARHVAPDRAAALGAIADAVRAAWLDELRRAYLTGAAGGATRARVTRRLIDTARAHLARLDGAHVADDGRIVLPTPLAAPDVVAPWTALIVAVDRAAPVPLTSGGPLAAIGLDGDALAAVGRLIGLLDAGVGPVEVSALAQASPSAKAAWGRLLALDLLRPAPARPALTDLVPPGHVATLGARTLLAHLGDDHALVDPALLPRSRLDRAPLPVASDLPVLSAILLSSGEVDVPTLVTLDKRVPIFLPPASFAPGLARLIADLGFVTIAHVVPRRRFALAHGAFVLPLAIPGRRPAIAYALVDPSGAAMLAAAGVVLDMPAQLAITSALREIGTPSSRISPLVVDVPAEPSAVCERGWAWLLEPAEHWTAALPDAPPALDVLARAARTRGVVTTGEGAAPPGTTIEVVAATPGAVFPMG